MRGEKKGVAFASYNGSMSVALTHSLPALQCSLLAGGGTVTQMLRGIIERHIP